MEPIIDAEATQNDEHTYIVTIRILMPSNQKVTDYPITVTAGDQVEALARAYEEWDEKTNRDNFVGTDIKKVNK